MRKDRLHYAGAWAWCEFLNYQCSAYLEIMPSMEYWIQRAGYYAGNRWYYETMGWNWQELKMDVVAKMRVTVDLDGNCQPYFDSSEVFVYDHDGEFCPNLSYVLDCHMLEGEL